MANQVVISNGPFEMSSRLKQLLYARGSELVALVNGELTFVGDESFRHRSDDILLELVWDLPGSQTCSDPNTNLRIVEFSGDRNVKIGRVGNGPETIYRVLPGAVVESVTINKARRVLHSLLPEKYALVQGPVNLPLFNTQRFRTFVQDTIGVKRWICEGATQNEANQNFIVVCAKLVGEDRIAEYALNMLTDSLSCNTPAVLAV